MRRFLYDVLSCMACGRVSTAWWVQHSQHRRAHGPSRASGYNQTLHSQQTLDDSLVAIALHVKTLDHDMQLFGFQGWPAIAKMVLPAASAAHGTIAGVIDSLQARDGGAGGLSALQLAVRSGSAPTVRLLLDWAQFGGARWAVASGSLRGITAMHLAALLQDRGEVGALLRGARADLKLNSKARNAQSAATPALLVSAE